MTKKYKILFEFMKQFVYSYSEAPFTLASGKQSHHYFNCKELVFFPERLSILSDFFVNEFIPQNIGLEFESIGGLTLGADPITYSIALEYHKNKKNVYPLVVRKEAKDHGTKKLIEGAFTKVKNCLVIDDVITTGGSTLKAVQALRNSGIIVQHGICILDREEGGREVLMEHGVTMHSIFKKSDFSFVKDKP